MRGGVFCSTTSFLFVSSGGGATSDSALPLTVVQIQPPVAETEVVESVAQSVQVAEEFGARGPIRHVDRAPGRS